MQLIIVSLALSPLISHPVLWCLSFWSFCVTLSYSLIAQLIPVLCLLYSLDLYFLIWSHTLLPLSLSSFIASSSSHSLILSSFYFEWFHVVCSSSFCSFHWRCDVVSSIFFFDFLYEWNVDSKWGRVELCILLFLWLYICPFCWRTPCDWEGMKGNCFRTERNAIQMLRKQWTRL